MTGCSMLAGHPQAGQQAWCKVQRPPARCLCLPGCRAARRARHMPAPGQVLQHWLGRMAGPDPKRVLPPDNSKGHARARQGGCLYASFCSAACAGGLTACPLMAPSVMLVPQCKLAPSPKPLHPNPWTKHAAGPRCCPFHPLASDHPPLACTSGSHCCTCPAGGRTLLAASTNSTS